MQHFVSVIFENQLNENKRDIVLDTMINTARAGLVESNVEYELFESKNSTTVLRLPLSKPIAKKHQQRFVETLANKLFDKGHNNFDIELTEATLRRGSRGEEVRALQAQLGMPESEQDGIFGPRTEQALRAFQQRAGIQVDGIAGGQTQAALAAGGAPRNAGAARPSTTPFQAGQGGTTQAPPAQTTAAPAQSPRPPARPTQTTTAPQQGGQGATASGAQGDGLRGGPAPAPQTATGALRARLAGQPAPRASNSPDPNDPRGDQIAPPSSAAPQAQTTAPTQPGTPVAQGAVAARIPRTDFAQQGRDATRSTTAPTLGQPAAADAAPAVDTNPPARPARTPQAQTTPGSSRPAGQPGRGGMAGDETNALDAIAADRAAGRLPDVPADAGPRGVPADGPAAIAGPGQAARPGPRPAPAQPQRGVAGANPDANDPRAQAPFDSGSRGNPNLPEPEAMTTSPTLGAPAGADAAPNVSATQDPAVSLQTPAAPQFGGGERTFDVDTNPPSEVAPQVDTEVANGMAGTFYQAMKGGTGIGTNEGQIQRQLQQMTSADMFNATAEAYQREHGANLFQHFYDEMNDRDIDRYVRPELERLGIEMPPRSQFETVSPRPKGAFMFRERNEWDALYSRTHNRDGSLKAKTNLLESRKYDEVTYHDDDQFFEDYGVMWYNDDDIIDEAEYRGRKVKLGKPMKGDVKKFKVYVRNPKGNVVKVNFGQKGVKIKKSNPERRRSFRARHNCDNPGPRHKARYWSCRKW